MKKASSILEALVLISIALLTLSIAYAIITSARASFIFEQEREKHIACGKWDYCPEELR